MDEPLIRKIEVGAENAFFFARWFIAPMYFALALSLIVMTIKFGQTLWHLFNHCLASQLDDVVVNILQLLDITMVSNLILVVMFAGYENFVSKLDVEDHPDRPRWMAHVTFGGLKIMLLASIVAMSAIHLLTDFFKIGDLTNRQIAWSIALHVVFVLTAVLMAYMDRILEHSKHARVIRNKA